MIYCKQQYAPALLGGSEGIIHYEAGQFNAKYKTDLTGKLEKTDLDRSLSEAEVGSFKDGYYQTFVSLETLILYRIYGFAGGSGAAIAPKGLA